MNNTLLTTQGSGKPIIWMHGMLNSVESDSIYSLVDFGQLSQQSKLIRYNAHNKSVDGDYSWDGLVHELSLIIDSLDTEKVILGGVSMGSITALYTAINNPDKVKALLLVTPPPAWENRGKTKTMYEKIAQKACADHIPNYIKRVIMLSQDPPRFYEELFPGTREKLATLRMSFEPMYYYSIYHGGALSDYPERELLTKLHIPTLIVGDPNDLAHPIEIAQEMNKLIPNSELFEISNADDYRHLQEKIKIFVEQNNNS